MANNPFIPASPSSSSHPNVPASPTAGGHPAIISGVSNPQSQIAKDVLNSLKGTGSLTSNSIHVSSIQSNIARALSVSNEFSNKPAQASLLEAQKNLNLATSAKDSATRNAALAAAKQALIQANNQMANLGYGKSIPSASPKPNITKFI